MNDKSINVFTDQEVEDYINNISKELKLNKVDVFLIKDDTSNAFVIQNSIYFTTGLFRIINYEDTLKSIYLHEYAHVIKNHFEAKKIKIEQSSNKNNIYNLFSFGLAVLTTNANIAIINGQPEILSTFKYIYDALGIESNEEDEFRQQPLVL